MNINILSQTDPKIIEQFKSGTTLPFNLHPWRFEKFLDKKTENSELTFSEFLKNESDKEKSHYSGIRETQDWTYCEDNNVLVSIENNRIDYSLVPLSIIEVSTNLSFKLGERHIVCPNKDVYCID
jgi:hypothetical protein